jgi:hypothetical protein
VLDSGAEISLVLVSENEKLFNGEKFLLNQEMSVRIYVRVSYIRAILMKGEYGIG